MRAALSRPKHAVLGHFPMFYAACAASPLQNRIWQAHREISLAALAITGYATCKPCARLRRHK